MQCAFDVVYNKTGTDEKQETETENQKNARTAKRRKSDACDDEETFSHDGRARESSRQRRRTKKASVGASSKLT